MSLKNNHFLFVKFLWGLLLSVIFFSVQGQDLPERRVINGEVVNSMDLIPLPNVHIINLRSERGTSSSADGKFMMAVESGDTILVQALGFHNDTLVIDFENISDNITLHLKEKVYDLPVVDIYPYATFTDFKYAFLNFKDPNPEYVLNLPELPNLAVPGEGAGIRINGPITALYEQFSKRGKQMRNYQQVLASEELHRKASRVVNVETVRKYTNLQDEAEIYRFLQFCNLTDEYIVASPDYLVYEQLLACFREYNDIKE